MFEHPETDPDEEPAANDLAAADAPGEGGYDLAEEDLYDDDGYPEDEDDL